MEGGLHLESVHTVLGTVLDQLQCESDSCTKTDENWKVEDFWCQFEICMKQLSAQTTKLTLAFSQLPFPSPDECKPLFTNLDASVLALLSVYYSLPASQGKTLHTTVKKSVTSVLEALQCLIVSLSNRNHVAGSTQHLQSTGTLWEICDQVVNLPRDNAKAVLVSMDEAIDLITDAVNELEEALKTDNVEEVALLADQLADVDLSDEEACVWSADDRLIVLGCLGMTKTAKAAIRKMSKAISVSGQCSSLELTDQLDSFLDHVTAVSPAVDDLVASVYPPLNLPAVQCNCEKMAIILRSLITMARSCHFTVDSDATWLDFLDKAVGHNLAKVIA